MKILLTILVLGINYYGFSQKIDSAWVVNNYTKSELMIPMRDGVKLFTAIYLPNSLAEKHPFIVFRTGYSAKPYGEKNFTPIWNSPRKYFFKENYIYVIQDVRGQNKSEGKFMHIRPYNDHKTSATDTDESTDSYDTIDWLVKNIPNNNNKVGVMGTSYPGFYAAMAALSKHPSLKAVSPQAPVVDWYLGDDYHHNGALMLMDAYFHHKKPKPNPTSSYPNGVLFPVRDSYAYFLRAGNIVNINKIMGDSVQHWKDIVAHPNYDTWWQSRNIRNYVQMIAPDVATLLVGGLFDAEDCYGALSLYRSIESNSKNNNKLVMGPWSHGQWGGTNETSLGNILFESNTSLWFSEHIEQPFFDYYLRGKGDINQIKEATIFFSGSNQWRQFDQWPAENSVQQTLYLENKGEISFHKKSTANKNDYAEYISDPAKPVPYAEGIQLRRSGNYMTDDQRFASTRTDVLVYQTAILEEDKTIAGPVIADLLVSSSTTDADFVVKLIDVFPDDYQYEKPLPNNYEMGAYQMLVRGDLFRAKFRNSFEKPEPLIPNKPTKVSFTLNDAAHTFKKGHRIMVQVQSSWFPLFDRNPQIFTDIYQAKISDYQKAIIRLYHNDSKILITLIKL
jgi:putative CocE/NonD family hydrolase